MFDVEGFILVGGQSRRMGEDKAQLRLEGDSILARLSGALMGATSRLSLVGARREYPESNLPNVPDVHREWGALAGIHAALRAAKSEWIIVVACDLPFVTRELFERLKTFLSGDLDAVVPVQEDGRPQPVCACYCRDTCLPRIEELIAAGEHTPRALLAEVRVRFVQLSELSDLPGADRFFFNMNTPEDFERANHLMLGENVGG